MPEIQNKDTSVFGEKIAKSKRTAIEGLTSASTTVPVSNPKKKCLLYGFPLELRRELYKVILAVWFVAEKGGGHGGDIHYIVAEFGQTFPCMGQYKNIHGKRLWAGVGENCLPAFELALLPEVDLHDEFITTRVEISTLRLTPSVPHPCPNGCDPTVKWPSIAKISPKLRGMVRTIAYDMELVYSPLSSTKYLLIVIDSVISMILSVGRWSGKLPMKIAGIGCPNSAMP
jgi:hypothetical protein